MELSLSKPQGESKRKVIKNCGWCEKENHWLNSGWKGGTLWTRVKTWGFTLSAVVCPVETKQWGSGIEFSFEITFAFSLENER